MKKSDADIQNKTVFNLNLKKVKEKKSDAQIPQASGSSVLFGAKKLF